MAEEMLKNCGVKLEDVDVVAVAAGPGSFTGLRIGVSAAKGLAWTLDKPCAKVSTLEAMAWNLVGFEGNLCQIWGLSIFFTSSVSSSKLMARSGVRRVTVCRPTS